MGIVRIVHRHDVGQPVTSHVVAEIGQRPHPFRTFNLERGVADEPDPQVMRRHRLLNGPRRGTDKIGMRYRIGRLRHSGATGMDRTRYKCHEDEEQPGHRQVAQATGKRFRSHRSLRPIRHPGNNSNVPAHEKWRDDLTSR